MKKRLVICLALALTIFFSQTSIAESQAQDSYVTIWEKYNEAFLRETDCDFLVFLLSLAQSFTGLGNRKDPAHFFPRKADYRFFMDFRQGNEA